MERDESNNTAVLDDVPIVFDSHYFAPPANQDPYPLYDFMRRTQPVYWSERMQAWAVFRYDDVSKAYRSRSIGQGDRTRDYVRKMPAADQADLHPLCPYMPRFISFLDPPEHRPQRDLGGQVLRLERVEAMRAPIQGRIDELLDRAAIKGSMEALTDFVLPLTSSTLCDLVGLPHELRPAFVLRVETIFAFLGSDHTDPHLARMAKEAYSWITAEIVSRLQTPNPGVEGLLPHLGQLVSQGIANVNDACGVLVGLVQGGFETTTSLISSAVFTLLSHPDQLNRVRSNPDLLPAAIVEVLRYESPFKYVMRQAYDDVELGGYSIRAGEHVMLMLGAANRDGAAFDHSDAFEIERKAKTHVSFGLGPHHCLGAPLAELQAQLAVGSLIERFDRLRLTQPLDAYRWQDSALLRRLVTLPVSF
jgi:cytochrome P450